MADPLKTKGGRVLSAAELEKLSERAAQGFDLSTWRRRRGGRPALESTGESPSPRIAVRVPLSLYRSVVARAAREHLTVSAVVRDLLKHYAER